MKNSLQVLLRVSIELFDRSRRVKKYLNDIGPGEAGEYCQLAETIQTALDTIEQTLISALHELWGDLAADHDESKTEFTENLYKTLAKAGKWFAKVHELLVYLPRMGATPETLLALQGSFGKQYIDQKPSIILGSLFNALEFDFFQLLKGRLPDIDDIVVRDTKNIVLQLAICDRSSPLAAAILGHELGHAIDFHYDISSNVASKFIQQTNGSDAFTIIESWCGEFTADLIAAEVLGPAPVLSLLSMEYCILLSFAIFSPSHTHPTTRWRLHVLDEFLRDKYHGINILSEERALYDEAWELNLDLTISDPDKRKEEKDRHDNLYNSLIKSIAKEIINEINKIGLPKHTLKEESLNRCVSRLTKGFPVGAQGVPREQLRDEISHFLKKKFSDPSKRVKAFRELSRTFKEDPLPIPAILMAGFRRRLDIIKQFSLDNNQLSTPELVDQICVQLEDVDAIIGNSITASTIHKNLNEVLDASTNEKSK